MSHLMNTNTRLPVSFVKGEGVWLGDEQGKRYLDAIAGVAVCGLGHCHPQLVKALCEQWLTKYAERERKSAQEVSLTTVFDGEVRHS